MTKAITLKIPWAWAVIHAGKDVENRSRRTAHRGLLYVHAGRSWSQDGIETLRSRGLALGEAHVTAGMVIGTVELVSVHHADDCKSTPEFRIGQDLSEEYCSEWAEPGQWHWVLADPVALPEPIAMPGKLGLWTIDEEVHP